MKGSLMKFWPRQKGQEELVILLAASSPRQPVLDFLWNYPGITIREAFTTQGVLQNLAGAHLVILGWVIPTPELSEEMLIQTLETSQVLVVSPGEFSEEPEEWLGRARLTSTRQVVILPSRQVNLVNWSGGVGKTTLAMAICKRFVERTSLPASSNSAWAAAPSTRGYLKMCPNSSQLPPKIQPQRVGTASICFRWTGEPRK